MITTTNPWYDVKISSSVPMQADLERDYAFMLGLDTTRQNLN